MKKMKNKLALTHQTIRVLDRRDLAPVIGGMGNSQSCPQSGRPGCTTSSYDECVTV